MPPSADEFGWLLEFIIIEKGPRIKQAKFDIGGLFILSTFDETPCFYLYYIIIPHTQAIEERVSE